MEDLSGKELLDTGGLIPDVYSKPAPKAKKPAPAKKAAATKPKKARKPAKRPAKATKPKKARPPKRPNKPVKVIAEKTGKPVKKAKATAPAVVRSERLDLRLSKREKAMLRAKAVKLRRTLTSIFIEFVEKLK